MISDQHAQRKLTVPFAPASCRPSYFHTSPFDLASVRSMGSAAGGGGYKGSEGA